MQWTHPSELFIHKGSREPTKAVPLNGNISLLLPEMYNSRVTKDEGTLPLCLSRGVSIEFNMKRIYLLRYFRNKKPFTLSIGGAQVKEDENS